MSLAKYLLLFVGMFMIINRSGAQVDTEFWFAAPEVSVHTGNTFLDRPIFLRITTYSQPATVTVRQPAGGGMPDQVVNIPANSTHSINLTTWIDVIESKPANTTLNYGLQIIATAPVTVYYDVVSGGGVAATNNPEAFSLKGRNALGTSFLIPAQNYLNNGAYNPVPYNAFDIIATENNTTVTITPTSNIAGHTAGTAFTVTLNAGQVYSAVATSQAAAAHLQGSTVVSDKPIAITATDDLLNGAPFGGCADLAGDQIVPIALLGTEYIAMKGLLNNPGDQVFVTAVQNGTTVSHNGAVIATLNAGQTERITVGNPSSYITSSLPVSVWQLSGIGCEVGACQLPQIFCTGSTSVSYTRATATSLYFNLLVQAGGQGDFLVNGATGVITAAQFTAVPGTAQWYTAQVSIPISSYPQGSVISISNTSSLFHMGVLEGSASGGTSYGYFSNFGFVSVEASARTSQVCVGDSIHLFAATAQGATYSWTGPNGFNSSLQNPVIPNAGLHHSGIYTLTVDMAGCGSGTDTVHVHVNEYPLVDLGNDIAVCRDSAVLTAGSYPDVTYHWSNGANTPSVIVRSSGTYRVTLSRNGCEQSDTIEVKLGQMPVADLGPDMGVCDRDTPLILNSVQPPGAQYLWSNGLSANSMAVSRSGKYWLEVRIGDCKNSDTVRINIVPTPTLYIGADSTICEQFPARIGGEVAGASYEWNNGSTNPFIQITETGTYILTANLEGCLVHDTIFITAMPPPESGLSDTIDICPEDSVLLVATHDDGNIYLWSTGDTTSSISVTEPGYYSLTITSAYHCISRDSILVALYPLPAVSLGADTSICQETDYTLTLTARHRYADAITWQDGSTGDTYQTRDEGQYIVTGSNKCGATSDTVSVTEIFCDIRLPNVFTPNGDGLNDIFFVLGTVGRLQQFEFSIYNRWGEKIFSTTDRYKGWDGKHNGGDAMEGTYVYTLTYTLNAKPVLQKGNFHLLR